MKPETEKVVEQYFYSQIYRSQDKHEDCDLWKDGFFKSRSLRYLCVTRDFPLGRVSMQMLTCIITHVRSILDGEFDCKTLGKGINVAGKDTWVFKDRLPSLPYNICSVLLFIMCNLLPNFTKRPVNL